MPEFPTIKHLRTVPFLKLDSNTKAYDSSFLT